RIIAEKSWLCPPQSGFTSRAEWDSLFLFSSIHESLSYLEGRATVFHSCYLSVCADTGTTEMPSVVLGHFVLPPACLQEGQAKKLIWGYFPREIPHDPSPGTGSPLGTGRGSELSLEPSLLQVSTPSSPKFPYRALQKYPINNMVTGYASARDMKKYEGELHDFIPGTSGYAAYWVQSKFNIYCKKTKMKRKL
uniref:Telomere repeat binding bouquet formation protein 2 n=1 Tax=Catharus ustulatus TaxID=91951 RepID=A0A8C3XXB9_CATUS